MRLYETYHGLRIELDDMKDEDPERPLTVDPDRTYEDRVLQEREYDLEIAKFGMKEQRLLNRVSKAERDWKKQVLKHKDIIAMTAKARKYKRNLNKFTRECNAKGRSARLAVSISSKEVRTAIKDILKFTISV